MFLGGLRGPGRRCKGGCGECGECGMKRCERGEVMYGIGLAAESSVVHMR